MTDFEISFNHVDQFNNVGGRKYFQLLGYNGIDVGADTIQALADADGLMEAYEATTKSAITNFSMRIIGLDIGSLLPNWDGARKLVALAGADNSERADYTIATVPLAPGVQTKAKMSIVAPVDDLFVNAANSRLLSLTAGEISDLVAQFIATAGGEPVVSDGQNTDITQGPNTNGVLAAQFNTRKTSGPKA